MVNIRISMFLFITCRGSERDWFDLPGDRAEEENLATERLGAGKRSALSLRLAGLHSARWLAIKLRR